MCVCVCALDRAKNRTCTRAFSDAFRRRPLTKLGERAVREKRRPRPIATNREREREREGQRDEQKHANRDRARRRRRDAARNVTIKPGEEDARSHAR